MVLLFSSALRNSPRISPSGKTLLTPKPPSWLQEIKKEAMERDTKIPDRLFTTSVLSTDVRQAITKNQLFVNSEINH